MVHETNVTAEAIDHCTIAASLLHHCAYRGSKREGVTHSSSLPLYSHEVNEQAALLKTMNAAETLIFARG